MPTKPLAKRIAPWAGLGLACAACCTVPFLLPLVVGLGLSGLAAWFTGKLEVIVCTAAAIGVVGVALLSLRRRPAPARGCKTDGPCGCGPDT